VFILKRYETQKWTAETVWPYRTTEGGNVTEKCVAPVATLRRKRRVRGKKKGYM
jgi:hypothetical protein